MTKKWHALDPDAKLSYYCDSKDNTCSGEILCDEIGTCDGRFCDGNHYCQTHRNKHHHKYTLESTNVLGYLFWCRECAKRGEYPFRFADRATFWMMPPRYCVACACENALSLPYNTYWDHTCRVPVPDQA